MKVGYGVTLEWSGRQLTKYNYSDDGLDEVYTYTYNADGIRTSKNVSGALHKYNLSGSTIVSEETPVYVIVYIYDELGSPIGMKYRKHTDAQNVFSHYFFEKNLQGDIVAIYNEKGTKIASYTYDAWCVCVATYTPGTSSTDRIAAIINPIRYRGYYLDVETDLYYLQSRYYNPNWGRFLNADGVISGVGGNISGNNMFAYCFNNPISMIDANGHWPKWVSGTLNVVGGSLQMAA
ncbi:MAG: RHS repeat-associated core domain-containing protein, partial [Crenarchaeota archaeon]|nr:RHS repeat-associated core domain-containing protein [Thermoproteota archaeon]